MKTERSEKLFKEAVKMIPGGVNSPVRAFGSVGMTPRFIASAEGAYMTDADGNRYLDYVGSWGPKILGHTTGVSSFWVLFAILLFGGMWGVVGMVIGVPLFAVIYDIIRKLVYRGLRKHKRESMITDYEEKYHKS